MQEFESVATANEYQENLSAMPAEVFSDFEIEEAVQESNEAVSIRRRPFQNPWLIN